MNPYRIDEPTVISFSGGRTSAYMLHRILKAHDGQLPDEAVVCFCNTGKEEEATLQFVHDCEQMWDVPIVWLEYQVADPKFKVVDFASAARQGEPFEALIKKRKYLPNPVTRFCTTELKVSAIDRYMKSVGMPEYVTMVGIRADEPRRVAKMRTNKDEKLTPLATDGVTEADVWTFWNQNEFDLQLPKVSGASNCDLCFLKGAGIVASLIAEKPERAVWWARMEQEIGGRFMKDRPTYQAMMNYQKDQIPLFEDESLSCFCGD